MEVKKDSPFVDDDPDEAYRSRYAIHAREVYENTKSARAEAHRSHVEYGKWLIASLLAIHGGAIYAISTLREGVQKFSSESLIYPVTWNIAGICFAIFAGFMAWLNFQCAEQIYYRWANPAMLFRKDAWPEEDERFDPISATLFLAAAFGFFSIWAFIASAAELMQVLKM